MIFRRSLLVLFLLPLHAQASDPLSWTELEVLYHSDLAIDAQLVRQDEAHFWVRVNTVLRDQGYGILAGDAGATPLNGFFVYIKSMHGKEGSIFSAKVKALDTL